MNYYEEQHEDDNWIHRSELPDLDHLVAMYYKLQTALYTTGNVADIADALDEMGGVLDIPSAVGDLAVQRIPLRLSHATINLFKNTKTA